MNNKAVVKVEGIMLQTIRTDIVISDVGGKGRRFIAILE